MKRNIPHQWPGWWYCHSCGWRTDKEHGHCNDGCVARTARQVGTGYDMSTVSAQAAVKARPCQRCGDMTDLDPVQLLCKPCMVAMGIVVPMGTGAQTQNKPNNTSTGASHPFICPVPGCGRATKNSHGPCLKCIRLGDTVPDAEPPKGVVGAENSPQIRLKPGDRPSWEFLGPPM